MGHRVLRGHYVLIHALAELSVWLGWADTYFPSALRTASSVGQPAGSLLCANEPIGLLTWPPRGRAPWAAQMLQLARAALGWGISFFSFSPSVPVECRQECSHFTVTVIHLVC